MRVVPSSGRMTRPTTFPARMEDPPCTRAHGHVLCDFVVPNGMGHGESRTRDGGGGRGGMAPFAPGSRPGRPFLSTRAWRSRNGNPRSGTLGGGGRGHG